MRQRLVILACLTGCLLGWPSVAENQQRGSHATNHESDKNNQPAPPTHVVIDPPFPEYNQPKPSDQSQQTIEKPLPRFARPEWVIVYVTVAYSAITLFMWLTIKRQAKIMEDQARDASESSAQTFAVLKEQTDNLLISAKAGTVTARATDESSKAALAQIEVMKQQAFVMERQASILEASVAIAQKSADAFVNAERARLTVVHSAIEPSVFVFHTKNSGRSSGLLMFSLVRFSVLKSEEVLPLEPDYLSEDEDSIEEEKWVLPGQSVELQINEVFERLDLSKTSTQIPVEKCQEICTGESKAWFYGYIRYTDSVSGEDKSTRFRFACYFNGEVFLLRDGPLSYNLET